MIQEIEIPWSELRVVLAVRRAGTLRGAAGSLAISHATISRRISELQDQLGVHVFEREGRRLRLTAAGEDLADTAARIEAEVHGLGRRIAGRDHRLEGTVRIALSPTMLAALAPSLPDFESRYPGIQLDLSTSLGFASLTRREADIAIRVTNAPHDTLVGRKLSLFEICARVSPALIDRAGNDPQHWPWVDWDEAHQHHSSARWMQQHIDVSRIRARCESSLTMTQLVEAGVGAGFVPTMLAKNGLKRVEPRDEYPVFTREIWVLTHADLRDTGRIRATIDWLSEQLYVEGIGVWRPSRTP